MKEITLYAGMTIDDAWAKLREECSACGETCYCSFNGVEIYSNESLDDAYKKIWGTTKPEHEKKEKEYLEEIKREEEEHKKNLPSKAEDFKKRARGLVLDEELEYWDKIVPIRLGDLYHGMELEEVLKTCAVMRNTKLSYDERLRKAYDMFMDAGHSGMSAGLTSSMIKRFCPDGADVADAVMNFRFDKKKQTFKYNIWRIDAYNKSNNSNYRKDIVMDVTVTKEQIIKAWYDTQDESYRLFTVVGCKIIKSGEIEIDSID